MNRAAIASVLALLVTGCASRGSVRQIADDLRGVQGEVGALRQSQEDLSRRLTDMARINQAAQAKQDPVATSIAAMKLDIERLTARVQAADGAIKDVKDTLAARAAAPPAPTPPLSAAPPPPAAEGAKPVRVSSAEDAFTAGLTNFRNREYGQAVLDLLDVVTKHPRHELAPTAQYLIGEAYYLQHDYRQALAEFRRAVEWPVPHAKIADALLKAGLCHGHLRESMEAQIAWRRVVREFPEAPAAEEARVLLAGKKPPFATYRR